MTQVEDIRLFPYSKLLLSALLFDALASNLRKPLYPEMIAANSAFLSNELA
jgi:hypothetical protein